MAVYTQRHLDHDLRCLQDKLADFVAQLVRGEIGGFRLRQAGQRAEQVERKLRAKHRYAMQLMNDLRAAEHAVRMAAGKDAQQAAKNWLAEIKTKLYWHSQSVPEIPNGGNSPGEVLNGQSERRSTGSVDGRTDPGRDGGSTGRGRDGATERVAGAVTYDPFDPSSWEAAVRPQPQRGQVAPEREGYLLTAEEREYCRRIVHGRGDVR